MTRWEYLFVDAPELTWPEREKVNETGVGVRIAEAMRSVAREKRASFEELLAKHGAEGWELVTAKELPRAAGDQAFGSVFVFKRPAGGEA